MFFRPGPARDIGSTTGRHRCVILSRLADGILARTLNGVDLADVGVPPREVARREALEAGRREVLRAILAGRGMSEIEPVLAEAADAELPLATVLAALEQSRDAADLRARLRAAAVRARRARRRPERS